MHLASEQDSILTRQSCHLKNGEKKEYFIIIKSRENYLVRQKQILTTTKKKEIQD
jgi:hypothetical protein